MTRHEIVPPTAWRETFGKGDRGADVASWQAVLVLDRRDVGSAGCDGVFGQRTHRATCSWQYSHGLKRTGIVGYSERLELGPSPLRSWRPPNLDEMRIVQAANWSREIPAQPKKWIVIHCMEAAETATTAENCAAWFAGQRGPAPRASAHYCVDADSVIQCVPEDRIAWHAPGANKLGVGIELAGYARQSIEEWRDDYSTAVLKSAAHLTWRLCRQFGIPPEFVAAEDLVVGESGITTHGQVTKAFRKSSHTDPGKAFPMSDFLAMTRSSGVSK